LFLAVRSFVFSLPVVIVARYGLLPIPVYKAGFYPLFLSLIPVFYFIAWFFVRRLIRYMKNLGFGRANTIAIGSDPDFKGLMQRLHEHPELGFNLVNILRTAGRSPLDGFDHVDVDSVRNLVDKNDIDQIVFSSSYQLNGSYDSLQRMCQHKGISMRIVSPESDLLFTKARLHDLAGIPLYTPEHRRLGYMKQLAKRIFDIIGSAFILLCLSPLFFVVAVAIKLESRGPVFFRHKRSLGAGDEPFDFFKFRSMRAGADKEKDTLRGQNESGGILFKIKDDPRQTKVGKIIRKYSIDELPQLLNVLRGEMSLVGPRPLPVKDYAHIDVEDHIGGYIHRRAVVKPGMTGLWQVSGRSDLGFREMVLLDLYYIENQSLLYDLEILAMTVPVVLFGKGAY
jgi:exopolysaccharide biosynthesis polyprenyl glycosylphosphotransferase